jgi:hypothetical protein
VETGMVKRRGERRGGEERRRGEEERTIRH